MADDSPKHDGLPRETQVPADVHTRWDSDEDDDRQMAELEARFRDIEQRLKSVKALGDQESIGKLERELEAAQKPIQALARIINWSRC